MGTCAAAARGGELSSGFIRKGEEEKVSAFRRRHITPLLQLVLVALFSWAQPVTVLET